MFTPLVVSPPSTRAGRRDDSMRGGKADIDAGVAEVAEWEPLPVLLPGR